MKTLIVFREGHSGNFLKSIILNNSLTNMQGIVQFKIGDHYPPNTIVLTHDNNYHTHRAEFDLVLRILPTRRIYSAIYNNFMKKLILEEYSAQVLDHWHNDSVYWHDRCYYNIVEYYDLITQDIQNNCYPNIIDFDQILDREYLTHIMHKYFQINFDHSRENIRKTYQELQLPLDLDQHSTSMADIVSPVTSDLLIKNPWFFSYCIHKYEKANGLEPKNRLWSINDIHQIPTKQLLLSLAQQYNSN